MSRTLPLHVLLMSFMAAMLAPAPAAQVPVGDGVRFSAAPLPFSSISDGAAIVDLASGALTPITGLSSAGSQAFSGLLDPIAGRLVLGTGGPPAGVGAVRIVRLNGSAVAAESVLAELFGAVQDVAIDRDGNYVVVELDQLSVVARQTGQVTLWDTDHYPGIMLAVATDRETNRCWVATSASTTAEGNVLIEYDLDAGPGPGTVLTNLSFAGELEQVHGLAHDGADGLYVGGSAPAAASPLVRYALSTGTFTTPATIAAGTNIVGVHVDRRNGDVHFVDFSPALSRSSWSVFDPDVGGTPSILATFPPGPEFSTGLDLNDLIDRTEVFPRHPSASSPVKFELAAHGMPGDLGFLAVTKVGGMPIAPLVIGSGSMDSGGFLALAIDIAPGVLPAGAAFTIRSARKQLATGTLILGTEADILVIP